jgi:hypothetical protein
MEWGKKAWDVITEGTEGEIESRTRRRKKVSTGWMDGRGKERKQSPHFSSEGTLQSRTEIKIKRKKVELIDWHKRCS